MSRVWFVTGNSRGLGRAFVEVALEGGDRVAATARHPERLQDLVDKFGDAVLPLRLDVTDYDTAARVVAQAVQGSAASMSTSTAPATATWARSRTRRSTRSGRRSTPTSTAS
jgi:NAD(P)-dependent dehydrogenase (short-subunit alcohol dehydrogenase family)